jgi:hypothetical protein
MAGSNTASASRGGQGGAELAYARHAHTPAPRPARAKSREAHGRQPECREAKLLVRQRRAAGDFIDDLRAMQHVAQKSGSQRQIAIDHSYLLVVDLG